MSTDPGAIWPEGYRRIVLDEVDSTNAEASRIAADLDRPTWIMAHRQTAARGRRGRAWNMAPGNFAATLLMRPGGVPAWAALRSFLAANAVFETLALHVDRTRLSNKWPNDVLLDGGKVAGILLESAGKGGQIDWLSIGIGVNLTSAPVLRDSLFPPVSLAEQGGANVTAETFLTELAGFYASEESILEQLGFAPIREKWLQNAARVGEVITARTADGEHTGTFETVDDAGQLVLITSNGPMTIPAADVYF
ncbi:biotin--[acetyl-CoA-carboxylase] ligase [Oceaniovalibus sp. ACAM 378]|uniref:biotin--[acetyl-CoA-carboxylase] ligase n=1 Tax=Oceaniovalibus sp. ACAM 378 TaxID=2599923 RepID=UPI0011DACC01|nr:biotin--[acetyl-CoA-carboxylase] ligase [Oceaniovalibus sp. ACAM 378]TYB91241.1 biotin--[acetyl-CoA-carboxylase] ligase [Oceaniovalibus sp. ACAM 378]